MLKNSVTAFTAAEFFIYGIIAVYAFIPCRNHRFIHGVYIGISLTRGIPMLSFAISKNICIEYTKITFYVCPYDNLVYIIYFVVFAKSRFKKFYFVAKSRPKKFAIHNQSPLKKFTICDMLCAKLGKRFGGSRDVKTKNRKAFD